ncbi:hypothetical protein [Kitasatospora aureofaciens]|uniref:hypothetical protein n=1 Tax=Kitasatospora aureofaciens TaxID=1894 RepID=UPI00131D90D6|nr:hypothetical protein [Kitasatospora aureofaciens]
MRADHRQQREPGRHHREAARDHQRPAEPPTRRGGQRSHPADRHARQHAPQRGRQRDHAANQLQVLGEEIAMPTTGGEDGEIRLPRAAVSIMIARMDF